MRLQFLFFTTFFLFLSLYLKAQPNEWADSVFLEMDEDQEKNFVTISRYSDTLLQLFSERKDYCKWGMTKIYKCYYSIHLNNYKDALQGLAEVMSNHSRHPCNSQPLLSTIYLTYASLYFRLGEVRKEIFYTQKGIDKWQDVSNDKVALIRLYHMKGDRSNDAKQQLYYYLLGYKLASESKNLKMQETMLLNIGRYYAMNNAFSKAEIFLRRSLTLAINRGSYTTLTSIYDNLAGIAKDSRTMRRLLDSSLYYAKLSGDLESLQTGKQNLAYLFMENKEYQKAYHALWESFELKDSVYNRNKIRAFADMEQKYEAEKKNSQIALLNLENVARSNQRNYFVAGTMLFMLLALAIFIGSVRTGKEKRKSEALLLNILPAEVADELKKKGNSEARLYENVTVLFTDFVNFTGTSSKMSPVELVEELHKNFTAFDAILEKHGLEKIKTIGDAYLAVCGLPQHHPDHAIKATRAAIEMRNWLVASHGKFQMRIGLNSGEVVAGIVGVKKYAYDIWGDTVNIASRMESNSEQDKINISGATYELIKNNFNCIYRGKINAKNLGEVDMYFVR